MSLAFLFALTGVLAAPSEKPARWSGVDETVIERFAEKAGRKAEPLLDGDEGDLLLFAFLVAGVIGGFIAGYSFRGLFPPKTDSRRPSPMSFAMDPKDAPRISS